MKLDDRAAEVEVAEITTTTDDDVVVVASNGGAQSIDPIAEALKATKAIGSDVNARKVTRKKVREVAIDAAQHALQQKKATTASVAAITTDGDSEPTANGVDKKRKALTKQAAVLAASITSTLQEIRDDKLANEKALKFVNFCRERIRELNEAKTPTVYSFFLSALATIRDTEKRSDVMDQLFLRLECLCMGVDSEGEAVQRPAAMKLLDPFFDKNGITMRTVDSNVRHEREVPLVVMITLLLGTCKLTDPLKKIAADVLLATKMLLEMTQASEDELAAHGLTVNGAGGKNGKPTAAALNSMSDYERTAWLIENGDIDKVIEKRRSKAADKGASASTTVEANGSKKRKASGSIDGGEEEEESDDDDDGDEDDDDDDDSQLDEDDGDGEDEDEFDDDEDEEDGGEGNEEEVVVGEVDNTTGAALVSNSNGAVVVAQHVESAKEKEKKRLKELQLKLKCANEVVNDEWNKLLELMIDTDDIYARDVQREMTRTRQEQSSSIASAKNDARKAAAAAVAAKVAFAAEEAKAADGSAKKPDTKQRKLEEFANVK